MPAPLISTPEAWDLATEATRQIHRERITQKLRSQRLRAGGVYGMAVAVGLFAVVAFLYGDREAGTVLAFIGCLLFGFISFAGKAGKKRLQDLLRDLDQQR